MGGEVAVVTMEGEVQGGELEVAVEGKTLSIRIISLSF